MGRPLGTWAGALLRVSSEEKQEGPQPLAKTLVYSRGEIARLSVYFG